MTGLFDKKKIMSRGRVLFLLAAALPAAAAAAPAVSTATLTVDEVYRAPVLRDPFIVSTVFGDEHAPDSRSSAGIPAVSTVSVYNLSLSGIMEDSRTKQALLSDKTAGLSYVLKGGRLYDARKRQVPGISGVIKGKQVILMTSEKQVHQLNLHERE